MELWLKQVRDGIIVASFANKVKIKWRFLNVCMYVVIAFVNLPLEIVKVLKWSHPWWQIEVLPWQLIDDVLTYSGISQAAGGRMYLKYRKM